MSMTISRYLTTLTLTRCRSFEYSTTVFPVQAPLPVSQNAPALAFLQFLRSFAGVRIRIHPCPLFPLFGTHVLTEGGGPIPLSTNQPNPHNPHHHFFTKKIRKEDLVLEPIRSCLEPSLRSIGESRPPCYPRLWVYYYYFLRPFPPSPLLLYRT